MLLISAWVGGVYPQVASRVLPRLKPGVGMTWAANPIEGKASANSNDHVRVSERCLTPGFFIPNEYMTSPLFSITAQENAARKLRLHHGCRSHNGVFLKSKSAAPASHAH